MNPLGLDLTQGEDTSRSAISRMEIESARVVTGDAIQKMEVRIEKSYKEEVKEDKPC